MRRNLLLMLVVSLAVTSCVIKYHKQEGEVRRQVQVAPFERISVSGSLSVYYKQADSVSVSIEGTADRVMKIEAIVSDNVLHLTPKGSNFSLLNININDDVRVYVTSPDLIGVELQGSGAFECGDPLDTDVLHLALCGSGDISFASVLCDRIEAEVMGSGNMKLGHVKSIEASLGVVGSGNLDVSLEHTEKTDIALTGSGDISVDFAGCGLAKCHLLGSGDIELSGSVRQLSKEKSGSGDIETDCLNVGG